jgi:Tol biopolymer transport system component
MKADGSGQRRLAGGEVAAWSPDGRTIAFERAYRLNPNTPTRRFQYRTEIDVMNADGKGRRRLAYGGGPLWSPDGRKIAFFSRRDGNRELYVMNPDGSGQRNLSRNPAAHDDLFAWAPAP